MVYGLVKQSNGHIKVYSETGEGTTIRIYLPRTKQVEASRIVAAAGPVRGGTETGLVVEDDDDVRATVVEIMAELGYRVLRARDAASGLAIIESGVPIDLLFTDVVMPGPMQSREMARRALERLPELAMLFASGYTENAIVHGGRLDDNADLISKPYTQEELAHRLRLCLDGRGPAKNTTSSTLGDTHPRRKLYKVLLVEDDVLIRMATPGMVEDLGHTVFQAGSARKALDILEANPVDILISDLGLPGVSGATLIAEVQKRWPKVRVIVASGLSAREAGDRYDLGEDVSWLEKPYGQGDIVRAIGLHSEEF